MADGPGLCKPAWGATLSAEFGGLQAALVDVAFGGRRVDFRSGPYECAEGADAVVLLTEWDQFRALDFARIKSVMKAPVVIDLRNIYRPEDMAGHGLTYVSIGRPG